MKRRQFLKSFAAVGAVPLIPSMGGGALAIGKATTASPVVSAQTYKWAEVIVRAHKTSSLAMLQRHLRVDATAAKALQNQLIRNGVIGAQANAYGLYQAHNPLFDGAFPKPANIGNKVRDLVEHKLDVEDHVDLAGEDEAEELFDDALDETSDTAVMGDAPLSDLADEVDWTEQSIT